MKIVIHNNNDSAHDRIATKKIKMYLAKVNKIATRRITRYVIQSKQEFEEYEAFFLITKNYKITHYRRTVKEAYMDALNADLEHPSFIRLWVKDNIVNLLATVESHIFADLDIDYFDAGGHLKQEVMDLAIENLKRDLMVN